MSPARGWDLQVGGGKQYESFRGPHISLVGPIWRCFAQKTAYFLWKLGSLRAISKIRPHQYEGQKNKIVETPSSYLSKRLREGQKTNGKRIESIGCFVVEKNKKNTQNNQYFGNRYFLMVFWIFLKNETRN